MTKLLARIRDHFLLGPQGSEKRKRTLEFSLNDCSGALVDAIFSRDVSKACKAKENYESLSYQLKLQLEAKQGPIKSTPLTINWDNVAPEAREYIKKIVDKPIEGRSWIHNAKRDEETDGLLLRYISGNTLAKIATNKFSGQNLFPNFRVPSLEDLESNESLDKMFQSNDFKAIDRKLTARYISLANNDRMGDCVTILHEIDTMYRGE